MLKTLTAISLLVIFVVGTPGRAQNAVPAITVDMSDPEIIGSGRTTFARSCAVGYCHGKEGRANRGPRFRGRSLRRDYLFRVIRDGIPRSSMPSWQQTLSDAEIWSVVAYIETLSALGPFDPDPYAPGGARDPGSAQDSVGDRTATVTTEANGTPADTVAQQEIAAVMGDPVAGEQLFFDSSQEQYCAGCHQVAGVGGTVGPDLSGLAVRSARSIFIDTILPDNNVSSAGMMYDLTTADDEQLRVVLAGETPNRIKAYSVSTFPPVLRSFRRDQVSTLQPLKRSGMPDIYSRRYTLKQLLDLVTFLKGADTLESQPISLADIL